MASQAPNDDLSITNALRTPPPWSTAWGILKSPENIVQAIGDKPMNLYRQIGDLIRLAKIRLRVKRMPHLFINPRGPEEMDRMNKDFSALKFFRSDINPLSVRRKARDLIVNINLLASQASDYIAKQIGSLLRPYLFPDGDLFIDKIHPTILPPERLLSTEIPLSSEVPLSSTHFHPQYLKGLCSTSGTQDQKREEIDAVLSTGNPHTDRLDVLLLGAGGTGKSTLIKQMGTTLQGFPCYNPGLYKDIIKHNVYAIVENILRFTQAGCVTESDMPWNSPDHKPDYARLKELCGRLRADWDRPEIRKALRGAVSPTKVTPDEAGYFLDAADRIFAADYVPTPEDVVRSRVRTTGIPIDNLVETSVSWRFIDTGGEMNQRHHWRGSFKNLSAIVFVVALPDFNRVMSEEPRLNAMHESLYLFYAMMRSGFFEDTLLVLLFTKGDVLEEVLEHDPESLKEWSKARDSSVPVYDGNSYADACEYIENRYISRIYDLTQPFCVQYMRTIDTMDVKDKCKAVLAEIIQDYISYPPTSRMKPKLSDRISRRTA
ncbi:G-protein alpha subunit-domain-containing protein [Gautieria morchelliformis]|nr:G-protein alpha subunit-domain-containing protein [Gautieria morchelliformis]